MKMDIQTALNVLNLFISAGIEYPEALYKASAGTGRSIQDLQIAYDSQ